MRGPSPAGNHKMDFRICSKCKTKFPAMPEFFYRNRSERLGLSYRCKHCASADSVSSRKKHDPTFERIKKWRSSNRDRVNEISKLSRDNRKNDPARLLSYRAQVREKSRRLRQDPQFRFLQSVRTQISMIIRGCFDGKGLLRRLQYSREELISHIEKQFTQGMSWANYGTGGWELDHIIPVSRFDLSNADEFRVCWSLSNLRPMWLSENRAKGARIS